jgi:hypothetical protein
MPPRFDKEGDAMARRQREMRLMFINYGSKGAINSEELRSQLGEGVE